MPFLERRLIKIQTKAPRSDRKVSIELDAAKDGNYWLEIRGGGDCAIAELSWEQLLHVKREIDLEIQRYNG